MDNNQTGVDSSFLNESVEIYSKSTKYSEKNYKKEVRLKIQELYDLNKKNVPT